MLHTSVTVCMHWENRSWVEHVNTIPTYTYLTSHRRPHYCLLHTQNVTDIHQPLGQSQVPGLKQSSNLDNNEFCLELNRTWQQNSLGRVASTSSSSRNFSSALFSSSAFSISFSLSMSIACRITYQHRLCHAMSWGEKSMPLSHTTHCNWVSPSQLYTAWGTKCQPSTAVTVAIIHACHAHTHAPTPTHPHTHTYTGTSCNVRR